MVDKRESYTKEDLLASGRGELFGAKGPQLPAPNMLMMDRVIKMTETGGNYDKGYVEAELDINPDLWFFGCHFIGDPVMPGCLGLDAMWQLVGFYLGWLGGEGKGNIPLPFQLHYRLSFHKIRQTMTDLITRPRRLRQSAALRALFEETTLSLNDLVLPIFVEEEIDDYKAIEAMPGVMRIPEKYLAREIERIANAGIRSVMTFGISHHTDATGSDTWNENGLVARMSRICKSTVPEMIVMSDTCFCEYTSHGHCGVLCDHGVDNDATLENLGKQAVVAAAAGADFIAPSAAMDGQVQAIRRSLDAAGFTNTAIMSYSTKFASSFYGPFREAAGTALKGDRKTYQMSPMNRREAIRESLLDEAQGADCLMVKPAGAYLDILRDIRERSDLPLGAYQVSGEYAMIKFAAQAGAIDEEKVVLESLGAIKRAGADLIFSYFALDLAEKKILR